MEREHFRPCMSVKVLVIANRVAVGRKEITMKDLKVLHVDCGSCLVRYCRQLAYFEWAARILTQVRAKEEF